jgi:molybdopterin-synthase adenylyltransferase
MKGASLKPRARRVLVIGMGGLGCPVSLALARAGVEHLTLMDDDVVELSNLHRQLWHHPADLGRLKVESAMAKLSAQFPTLSLDAVPHRVTSANAAAVFNGHDVVVDATDGVETKFVLSDVAVATGIPLIYGGVVRFEGLAMRIERGGPCLRCVFEEAPLDGPTCSRAGVLGSMAGVMGGLQALLVDRPIQAPTSMLHVVDGLSLSFRTVAISRRPDCEACGEGLNPVLKV